MGATSTACIERIDLPPPASRTRVKLAKSVNEENDGHEEGVCGHCRGLRHLRAVRTDNGPEFTSRVFMTWTQKHGIRQLRIQPGRPMQNGYIESFAVSSTMSISTSSGLNLWTRPTVARPSGDWTTTRSDPIAGWAESQINLHPGLAAFKWYDRRGQVTKADF
jgi:hypothetical protein